MIRKNPYVGDRFGVFFLLPQLNFNGSFKSVSGLNFNSGTATEVEGGVAGFSHQLTDRGSYGKLTLSRGFTDNHELYNWCQFTNSTMQTISGNILISLLDRQQMPVKSWLVFHAIPKSWTAGDLDASTNSIMMESVTFTYQNFMLI